MNSLPPPNFITPEQEKALKKLAWSIETSEGEFKLIFAHCNYINLQQYFSEHLQELCDIETLYIQSTDTQLYTVIKNQIKGIPKAIQVLGLEQVHLLEDVLKSADRVRNDFKTSFPCPLVIWVNNQIQSNLRKVAPNFESWGVTQTFPINVDYVNIFLQDKATFVLNSPSKLTRKAVESLSQELIAAKEDLTESDGTADFYINFLLGYFEEINRNFEQAIAYYKIAKKNLELCSLSQLFKVGLWVHLTYCSYAQASQVKEIKWVDKWRQTKEDLENILEILEAINNQELIAKFLSLLGNVLIQFKQWNKLKEFAEISLEIHQLDNNFYKIAQDKGFLAEVCFSKKQWTEAINLGKEALKELDKIELSELKSLQSSKLLLIIGKATAKLKNIKLAIKYLEEAKKYNINLDEPNVYINIVQQLHQLYFKQEKDYLEAFKISQEIIKVKRQVGQFAFIGISQIALPLITDEQETIAPEIMASGRENDVNELVERVMRNDYKVIVIYGESGVGKSSLINGGFIPCLRSKSLGEEKIYPIYMRVYSHWTDQLFANGSENCRVGISQDINKNSNLNNAHQTEENLLNQLQMLVNQKLRPVFIFDQFEEFFFVQKTTQEKHRFFNFLGKCLELSNIKIVFSLRKDYVHYLLDVPGMDRISNDILGKEVLYKIGDFTPEETKEIIHKITQLSQLKLEDDLIDQLVKDLTEDGRIRPIELQVVGSQLQQRNITMLAEYHQNNGVTETGHYKEKLVHNFLHNIVKGCGQENELIADLLLYLLTDDKGTRPIKTRKTIEQELKEFKGLAPEVEFTSSQLTLVLNILVMSGLIIQLQDNNYQLWHDYFVRFIREKQEPQIQKMLTIINEQRTQLESLGHSLQKVEAEITEAENTKEVLKEQNRKAKERVTISGVIAASFLLVAIGSAFLIRNADLTLQATNLKVQVVESNALWIDNNDTLDSLLTAIKTGKQLQTLLKKKVPVSNSIQWQTKIALQQALETIKERNRLQGHQSWVWSLAFTPDGKTLASGIGDNSIKLWDVSTEKELKTLDGHQRDVWSVAFTPDGQTLASGSADNSIKLWDVSTGKELKTLDSHQRDVWSVAFTPDGKTLASGSADNSIKLWDVSTGKELKTLDRHQDAVRGVAFSSDGQTLASGSYDNSIKLWDVSTGKELKTLDRHQRYVFSVSFTPDGKILASGSADNSIKLWDVSTGKELKTLSGHPSRVLSVSFTPDGKTLASGSDDNSIKLWDVSTGKELKTLDGHQSSVWSVSFTPDGKTLASGNEDNSIILWNFDLDKLMKEGCQWIDGYLQSHEQEEELREICWK